VVIYITDWWSLQGFFSRATQQPIWLKLAGVNLATDCLGKTDRPASPCDRAF
jgi:hypothetical protein